MLGLSLGSRFLKWKPKGKTKSTSSLYLAIGEKWTEKDKESLGKDVKPHDLDSVQSNENFYF